MVIKYDLFDIPVTKSDKFPTSLHYKMKKRLVEWLRDHENILTTPLGYEKTFMNGKYCPDVCTFKKCKEVWIEVETNPFSVFHKLVELLYLQTFRFHFSCKILIFGIHELPQPKSHYLKVFDILSKHLIRIREIRLYLLDNKNKIRRIR